jgi:hypothetical protein
MPTFIGFIFKLVLLIILVYIAFICSFSFCRIISMFTDHTATMHLAYLLGGPYCKDGVNGFSVGRIHAAEYMFYRYILNQSIHTSLLHRSQPGNSKHRCS